jgi:zinc/manganese transport system substrate-binding protein
VRKTRLSVLIFTPIMLGLALGQNSRVQVATSFSILEDLVQNVGQDRVQVRSFVPRNGDSHSFEPGTQDVRTLSQAKVVFINGLGLEAWFEKLLSNAASNTSVITLSDGLKPRQFLEDGQRINDPHMWWDLTRTRDGRPGRQNHLCQQCQKVQRRTDQAGRLGQTRDCQNSGR